MSRNRHPLVALTVAAVLFGALSAAGLALAVPQGGTQGDGTRHAADPLAPAANAPATAPAEPVEGPPVELHAGDLPGDPRGGDPSGAPQAGDPQIEARAEDPLGGPPWAVRVAQLERDGRRLLCAQLGREWRGRFGWVDAADRFRELPFDTLRQTRCAPAEPGAPGRPQLDLATRVADPAGRDLRVVQSVAWGIAGAAASVELTVDGYRVEVPATPSGVVLAPLRSGGPGDPRPEARAVVRPGGVQPEARPDAGAGSPPVVVEQSFHGDGLSVAADAATPEGYTRQQWVTVPVPGRAPTPEYRTPDPAGGAPWGVVAAPARDGGWCVSGLGRAAGERVGFVDADLGTFTDEPPGWGRGCGSPAGRPTRERPVALTWTGWRGDEDPAAGTAAEQARIERRLQRGRMAVSGIVHPDVVAITIATPRDVRTLTPSRRAHAFAAVYDGQFSAAEVRIDVRFRDGTVLADAGPY